MTINLDDQTYAVLAAIAGREDVPVAQLARLAIMDYLAREEPTLEQLAMPLIRSSVSRAGEQGR